jgi:hypothetical protein
VTGGLDRLERDVVEARSRMSARLASLRSPSNMTELKRNAVSEATRYKDHLVGRAKEAGRQRAGSVLESIKDKAAANPAAALAVLAGVGWRLYRHPPIASVLVGLGVASLARTDPDKPAAGAELLNRATAFATSTLELKDGATIPEMKDAGLKKLNEIGQKVMGAASTAGEAAMSEAQAGSAYVQKEQDKILLGAAAFALIAAAGISYRRGDGG